MISRKNKNKKKNDKGRKFLELVDDIGWYILNGTNVGDKEGEYTYVGPSDSSVIGYTYTLVNENCKDIVNNFYVKERGDSDHMPLITEMEEDVEVEKEEEKEENTQEKRMRICWDEETKRIYMERTEEIQE